MAAVNYYKMDVELLFSRKPFAQNDPKQFSFIKPNRTEQHELSVNGSVSFELPKELCHANVVIEAVADGIRRSMAYYANDLRVHLIEPYGQVQIASRKAGQPLAGVYVKTFARTHSGEIKFYKDGYTDPRGRFDYASLSTSGLDDVERFALLLLSTDHGAIIREVAPPGRG
jgi:hypothetical protein